MSIQATRASGSQGLSVAQAQYGFQAASLADRIRAEG
jgi:hypothetical protein